MVRIFTVAEELPFAGHPTLGTASVVAHARQVTEVALDLKVGRIPVSFKTAPDGLFGEMTQRDLPHPPQECAPIIFFLILRPLSRIWSVGIDRAAEWL